MIQNIFCSYKTTFSKHTVCKEFCTGNNKISPCTGRNSVGMRSKLSLLRVSHKSRTYFRGGGGESWPTSYPRLMLV